MEIERLRYYVKSLEMGNLFQTLLSNWLHFNFKTKIKKPSNQRCLWTKNWASDIVSSKKREEDKARIWTWPTALFSNCYICFYFPFFSTFIYCFLFYLLFLSSVYFIGKNVNMMCFYLPFSTLTYTFVYIYVLSCFSPFFPNLWARVKIRPAALSLPTQ